MALPVLDLCDRCRSRGQVALEWDAGYLVLCSHHAREHGPTMRRLGWRIVQLEHFQVLTPEA